MIHAISALINKRKLIVIQMSIICNVKIQFPGYKPILNLSIVFNLLAG